MIEKKNVKIALGQMRAVSEDTETNFRTMEQMIEQAAAENVDLICFPELSYTGYFVKRDKLEKLAEPWDGSFAMRLCKCAKKNHIHIIAGYAEREQADIYNSCLIVSDEGQLIGNVRKVHLWKSEKKRFIKGNEFPVFDTAIGKIAVLNCYDLEFPEPARIVALKGAEIIFCPAAWSRPSLNRWNLDIRGNSLFNLLFTVGANFADELCCGSSAVAGPDGEMIVQASLEEEEVITAILSFEQIEKQRLEIPYFEDMEKELFVRELEKLL